MAKIGHLSRSSDFSISESTRGVGPSNAMQRSQLKLRLNLKGEWEVYASIHGTAKFRWWIISEEKVVWYRKNFPEIETITYTDGN
jgi:hypothetical protein